MTSNFSIERMHNGGSRLHVSSSLTMSLLRHGQRRLGASDLWQDDKSCDD